MPYSLSYSVSLNGLQIAKFITKKKNCFKCAFSPAANFWRCSLCVVAVLMDTHICQCVELLAADMAPIQHFTRVDLCVCYKCVQVRKCLLAVFLYTLIYL